MEKGNHEKLGKEFNIYLEPTVFENGGLMAPESSPEICTQMALKCSPNSKSEHGKSFYYLLAFIKIFLGLFHYFNYFINIYPQIVYKA